MEASKRTSGAAGFLFTTIAVLSAVSVGGTSLAAAQAESASTTQSTAVDATESSTGDSTGGDISMTGQLLEAPSEAEPEARLTTTTAESETEAQATATVSDIVARRGDRGPTVTELQRRLNQFGFDAGPVDGIFGGLTEAAVRAFQAAVGLPVSGVYDRATATALGEYEPSDPGGSPVPAPTMTIRDAQRLLNGFGFDAGPVDGLYGPNTRAGLTAFQRAVGLPVTGRLDQATITALGSYDGSGDDTDDTGDAQAMTVRQIQQALADGPFDPGPVDGQFGTKTRQALWALEKLAGLAMDGKWGDAEQAALRRVNSGAVGGPRNSYSRRWVEIDLSQQLVMVYDPGRTVPRLVTHTSTGSGNYWRSGPYSGRSITPTGRFTIFRRISGWHYSSLGLGGMYNPLYITSSGIALHGSSSVPPYPASHGCIRLPMHIAEYMPSLLPNGTPVVIRQ
jgi:peptidoglycan hydrolase-like protein with peptidoglycan-binding domain